MTHTEQKVFRTTLEAIQSGLLGDRGRGRESLTIDASPDDLDRLQSSSDRDYAIGCLERNSSRLRDVRNALRRVSTGEYGICDSCDEDIKPKRLAAVPWASSCVACQELADRLRKNPEADMAESLALAA